MKSISLKLQDKILSEVDSLLAKSKKSRNKYINEAIDYYNKLQKRKLLEEQLRIESQLVSEDSLRVLVEFENLEDEM